jgi:N-acetylglucosamine repressor
MRGWQTLRSNIDAVAMRQLNRSTVLNIILEQQPLSRMDIAIRTGLNKATVSSIVDDLLEHCYIHELGHGKSSGGRKPILLGLNPRAAFSIGIDFQITHITAAVTNFAGRVESVHTTHIACSEELNQDHVVDFIVREVRAALTRAPETEHGVLGVGIAMPGLVNYQSGQVHYLPNIGITDWSLRDKLNAELGLPMVIDNDANCGAWAHYHRLSPRPANMVYVHAGVGIGAGIIVDGRLYRGEDGLAGEFGHTTIVPQGLRCACGNYGCWEQYASEQALLRYLDEHGAQLHVRTSGQKLAHTIAAQADMDPGPYREALSTLAMYIGMGVANIANSLNPGAILIGGTLAAAGRHLQPEVERVLRRRAISLNKQTGVRFVETDAVAVGAAWLATWEAIFKPRR